MTDRTYIAIDLKSFYASVECMDRNLDPMTTNLVVADESRTEKTICFVIECLSLLLQWGLCLKSHGLFVSLMYCVQAQKKRTFTEQCQVSLILFRMLFRNDDDNGAVNLWISLKKRMVLNAPPNYG